MSNPAPSRRHIKRRLDDYLWRDRSAPLTHLRDTLRKEFMPVGPAAIIGGPIRDLAQVGPVGFKSDVDLVFDVDSAVIDELASRLGAVRNRFGGYGYSTPHWKIDFWALNKTWAKNEGHVKVKKLSDLLNCTFFMSDAILYKLNDRTLVANPQYVCDLYLRRLEINLLPNPSPDGNLVRAIRRLWSSNLQAGPKLRVFLCQHLNDNGFKQVVITEKRLYRQSYAEPYQASISLLEALLHKERRCYHEHGVATQYSLDI